MLEIVNCLLESIKLYLTRIFGGTYLKCFDDREIAYCYVYYSLIDVAYNLFEIMIKGLKFIYI